MRTMPLAAAAARLEPGISDRIADAKRLMKRARRAAGSAQDLKDDAAYYVRRHPIKALGIATGAGLLLGVAVSVIGVRLSQRLTCD